VLGVDGEKHRRPRAFRQTLVPPAGFEFAVFCSGVHSRPGSLAREFRMSCDTLVTRSVDHAADTRRRVRLLVLVSVRSLPGAVAIFLSLRLGVLIAAHAAVPALLINRRLPVLGFPSPGFPKFSMGAQNVA
jgi:hypothetical protein